MSYYKVLGVKETATDSQIRDAYRNAVRRVHPDTATTLSDTASSEIGKQLRHAAVRNGLISFTAPFRPEFLQIWPPLTITAAEIDELLLRLGHAVQEASETTI